VNDKFHMIFPICTEVIHVIG